jgi:hypothetical protein
MPMLQYSSSAHTTNIIEVVIEVQKIKYTWQKSENRQRSDKHNRMVRMWGVEIFSLMI